MLEQNKAIHEFTGVAAFHAAGYTGSRTGAATGERIAPEDFKGGWVQSLVGAKSTPSHSKMTASVFFEVAPDAKLYGVAHTSRLNTDGSFTYELYDVLMPELEKLGVTAMFTSTDFPPPDQGLLERDKKFVKENDWFLPFWAAGNDGKAEYNGMLDLPTSIGVAAYYVRNGSAYPEGYSSESQNVDFSAPTNVKYQIGVSLMNGTGTSAAAPYLCGMAVLVQDFFIAQTGKPLKRDALIRFFCDNCTDLNDTGHDNKTGFGAVVLPDPDTIDVWAYQEGGPEKMKVEDFKDAAQISEWAKDGIQKCLDAGIMDGVGAGMFDPKGEVTREQLATVAARLMEVLA